MKKIYITLALTMMMGFAGSASSASLSWGAVQAGVTLTDTSGNTIAADYGFGHSDGSFSHTYDFTSSDASSPIAAQFDVLPRSSIDIKSITFDSVAMTFNAASQLWSGNGANILDHVIQISGTTLLSEGSQYQLFVASSEVVPAIATPIPATVWLFGSAFAGLMGIKTRKTGSKVSEA